MLSMVKKRNWRSNISLYQYAKANKKYMKDYDKNKESSYLQYWDRNNLNELHNDFYLKESKLKKSKSLQLIYMINKTEYVIHIRNLKQALDHGLVFKKVHKVMKFYHNSWLKPYIDRNTVLRKEAKNDFEKDFFKSMNNAVFRKTMENLRKHRDIKLVTTERRRTYLVSESNYHTTKFFTEHRLAIKMKKNRDTYE